MHNPERKQLFMDQCSESEATKRWYKNWFSRTAEFEEEYGKDLCAFSVDEMQSVVDNLLGVQTEGRNHTLRNLRSYLAWARVKYADESLDSILHVDTSGIDVMRRNMIGSPQDLQDYLDAVFPSVNSQTVGNVYRCWCWMAFCGVDKEDTITVMDSDVDLSGSTFTAVGKKYALSGFSKPAFSKLKQSDVFYISRKSAKGLIYSSTRARANGAQFLRTFSGDSTLISLTTALSIAERKATEINPDIKSLDYRKIWTSGEFYYIYINEMRGITPSFDRIVDKKVAGRDEHRMADKRSQCKKYAQEDYNRWKAAFFPG